MSMLARRVIVTWEPSPSESSERSDGVRRRLGQSPSVELILLLRERSSELAGVKIPTPPSVEDMTEEESSRPSASSICSLHAARVVEASGSTIMPVVSFSIMSWSIFSQLILDLQLPLSRWLIIFDGFWNVFLQPLPLPTHRNGSQRGLCLAEARWDLSPSELLNSLSHFSQNREMSTALTARGGWIVSSFTCAPRASWVENSRLQSQQRYCEIVGGVSQVVPS